MIQLTKTRGNTEWYTPPKYCTDRRAVLGEIDLDPASCAEANEIVQATQYYDIETEGLLQHWRGRVFLNPPYARGIINHFVEKLSRHYALGHVTEYIILVNAAMDTHWAHDLLRITDAVCFTRGRIGFITPTDASGTKKPPIGQAFFYAGNNVSRFDFVFSEFGTIVKLGG